MQYGESALVVLLPAATQLLTLIWTRLEAETGQKMCYEGSI